MKNFQRAYEILNDKIELLMNELRAMSTSGRKVMLYHEETVDMMINRWGKLEKVRDWVPSWNTHCISIVSV